MKQHMDTDDLSKEAYKAVISEAEKLTHDLTLHYGLLSYECNNETEYLENASKLSIEILEIDDNELDDIFWGDPPDKEKLHFTLRKIISNIEKINKIPIEKRHYD